MGLDLVETIYSIEEEFKITIPDEIATTLTTPRRVIDYLMSRSEVNKKWSRDYVVISVWIIIENEGGINREDFNEDSRFIENMGMG
jgi:hypothetical protein